MDLNEEFIMKKVQEELNELEILQFLDIIPLKSNHVISLTDSFNRWAILPKMVTVSSHVRSARKVFQSKISQVCLGLIKGLAYLHEHSIAHRDLKLENLVVNENFCLKIIDFNIAMRVEDEDEEVDDQCGTQD
jgi:serine/threonine protein kinase